MFMSLLTLSWTTVVFRSVKDKFLPLDVPWHQKLIETRTKFRSPLAPVIPDDLEVQPYLTAPFKKAFRDR